MKQVINGYGQDATAALLAWYAAGKKVTIAHLYLIGEPDHPSSIFLTDWESPLLWPMAGTFQPTVIKRVSVTQKIGLDVESLDITWSAQNKAVGKTIRSASPYQLARIGYFDNWPVRIWTVYMPTPGDCMTFGCAERFGGRWAKCSFGQGKIQFTVNSFLDSTNQQVPTNVIEVQNTSAAYTAATPPQGFVNIPRFVVVEGSSINVVVGYQVSPNAGSILDTNNVRGGFLVFDHQAPDPTADPPFPGSTLDGVWSSIHQNSAVTTGGTAGGGGQYNQFQLYANLPWPPTAGLDSFYVSGAAPVNLGDAEYYGFPYVPSSENAV